MAAKDGAASAGRNFEAEAAPAELDAEELPRLRLLAKVGIRFTGIANAFYERCFAAQAA